MSAAPVPVDAAPEAVFNCTADAVEPRQQKFVADEIFGDGWGWCNDPTLDLATVARLEFSEDGPEPFVAEGAPGQDHATDAGSGYPVVGTGTTECPAILPVWHRTQNVVWGKSKEADAQPTFDTAINHSGAVFVQCRLLNGD